ncbi:hypothetical protein K4F52_002128 [Lecanicillium sp. MT-2017a]|nr:hypothetical protein K4F52_002128 [Lecanicillium sp. MT-2017a]
MWLVNTTSLQLEWFVDPETDGLRYAILSHTWGTDEVSFQDVADLAIASRKAGFAKIVMSCRLALSEGYNYVWIDTCCIDKQSSAELSEAINSMYHWYEAAGVCYAFLSDLHEEPFVGLPDGFEFLNKRDLAWHKDALYSTPFARCRWFTRGWTLQELIAPSHVVFYDGSWNRIGDKTVLRHVISLITGVGAKILVDNTKLLTKSVWRRMSWAAHRQTSRVEDTAYCLLGIFDINMPLIYGEGYKAFQRLQEEITRKEGDPSILLWSSEGLPLPQFRPARYRHVTEPPAYRGAFAWAPSEFLSREAFADAASKDVRYDSSHVALPAQGEMSSQSTFVLNRGVLCVMEHCDESHQGAYFRMYLELSTSKGTVYRPVEKMTEGYVFEGSPFGHPHGERLPYKAQEVRLLGQHTTTLLETNKQRRICLGIDDGGINGDHVAWPEHRWEEDPAWWVYNDAEVLRAAKSAPTILGACQFRAEVRQLQEHGDPISYQLTLACMVGFVRDARPFTGHNMTMTMPSGLFGACFVKESTSKLAAALHAEMGDADMDAAVAFMQAHMQNNSTNFESGRGEIIELPNQNTRIQVKPR